MPRTTPTGWCAAPDLAPVSWLCDAMLGRLARLLRAAGEDAAMIDADADDRAVVARARREGRRLLTRDRRLAEAAGADALWIAAQAPMEQAEALARQPRAPAGRAAGPARRRGRGRSDLKLFLPGQRLRQDLG